MILAALAAFWVKTGVVDMASMATGKTPPSHSYRMAKIRERQAKERRRLAGDPDLRGGLKMVARHWYLDACEDLDHWRANRHATKPERKAARQKRSEAREGFTSRWGWRKGDPLPDDVVDAEIVDETSEFTPDAPPPSSPRSRARPAGPGTAGTGARRTTTTTTTTTSSTVTEEKPAPAPSAPGAGLTLLTPDESAEKTPLPYRRMVLMTMLSAAGYAPDTEVIGQMSSEEVDGAIAALIAHERALRAAAH